MSMLDELKSKLRITWLEEDTDLQKLIDSSKAYLEEITGTPLKLETDLVVKELVLERCRYVYNNAADEFLKNFADDLLRLRLKVATRVRREPHADL
jgi:hypothetical protein